MLNNIDIRLYLFEIIAKNMILMKTYQRHQEI